jgi:hypothetical protein
MEVSYENNINDSIALFRQHLTTDPDYRKRRNLKVYVTPLIIFTGITMFSIATKDPYIVIGGIVFALITYLWCWFAFYRYERKIVKEITQRPNPLFYCRHTVTISSEGLTEKTAETNSFQTWKSISNVAFTPDYIFVYNTPATAHVIPLRELGDTQFQQVSDEIQKYKNA